MFHARWCAVPKYGFPAYEKYFVFLDSHAYSFLFVPPIEDTEGFNVKDLTLKLFVKMQVLADVLKDEDGQDMVEYAIVMGLIALGATAAMKTLAGSIGTGLGSIGTKLGTYTT